MKRRDNVLEASTKRLPACRVCHVYPGDPCRYPSGKTRKPHKGRA